LKTINPTLLTELTRLEPTGSILYLVECEVNDSQTVYLTDNAGSVSFNGNTYETLPLYVETTYDSNTGYVTEASIRMGLAGLPTLRQVIIENRFFVDRLVTIRMVHSAHLADPNVQDNQSFVIRGGSVTRDAASFSLGGENLYSLRAPSQKFRRNFCQWVYNSFVIGVTNATNATPIVVTFDQPHGLKTGDRIRIEDVGGNTAANGADWFVTVINKVSVSLQGSVGNGAYTSGGKAAVQGPECGYMGSLLDVTGASNASPIVITTALAHGLKTGQQVAIASVGGNTAANGDWTVTRLSATTFSLDGSTGSGAYTSGGTASFHLPACDFSLNGSNGCASHRNTLNFRAFAGLLRT
jgi:hypothetical protein